jgi:hypothetical protein
MEIQATEYLDVAKRAEELGLNVPTGLAILPNNFDTATSADELIHEGTTPTIRSLWRQSGVIETRLEKDGSKLPQSAKKSADWISPIIFVSQAMLTNAALPLTINLISSYLYDLLKGRHGKTQVVAIRFVSERTEKTQNGQNKKSMLLTFKGTPQEWKDFDVDKVRQLLEGKNN